MLRVLKGAWATCDPYILTVSADSVHFGGHNCSVCTCISCCQLRVLPVQHQLYSETYRLKFPYSFIIRKIFKLFFTITEIKLPLSASVNLKLISAEELVEFFYDQYLFESTYTLNTLTLKQLNCELISIFRRWSLTRRAQHSSRLPLILFVLIWISLLILVVEVFVSI